MDQETRRSDMITFVEANAGDIPCVVDAGEAEELGLWQKGDEQCQLAVIAAGRGCVVSGPYLDPEVDGSDYLLIARSRGPEPDWLSDEAAL